jgi:hypothetical protein
MIVSRQVSMHAGDYLPISIVVAVLVAVALEKVVVSSARVGNGTDDVAELRCGRSDDCGRQGEKGDSDEGRGPHVSGVYAICNKLKCLEVNIKEVEWVRWCVGDRGWAEQSSVL